MTHEQELESEAPGIGAGERWETGRGDGSGIYIVGDPKRRVKIGDFALGGQAGDSTTCHERAQLAAQAPLMYEALLDLISSAREDGFFAPGAPQNPRHRVGCECGLCEGLVALVRVEGGGRCARCGCTDDDACESGCSWTSSAKVCCDAHPVAEIRAVDRLLAAPAKRGRRG